MRTAIIAPLLAILATGVVARNCSPGLDYCNSTLNTISNYGAQIEQVVWAGRYGAEDPKNFLFNCVGGSNGVIHVIGKCGAGCKRNGSSEDDVCK